MCEICSKTISEPLQTSEYCKFQKDNDVCSNRFYGAYLRDRNSFSLKTSCLNQLYYGRLSFIFFYDGHSGFESVSSVTIDSGPSTKLHMLRHNSVVLKAFRIGNSVASSLSRVHHCETPLNTRLRIKNIFQNRSIDEPRSRTVSATAQQFFDYPELLEFPTRLKFKVKVFKTYYPRESLQDALSMIVFRQ